LLRGMALVNGPGAVDRVTQYRSEGAQLVAGDDRAGSGAAQTTLCFP
jgi:hypothetical protein